MLVQIHYLDVFFDLNKDDQPKAHNQWKTLYHVNYLLCVDILVDFNASSTEDYGHLFRNIFYILRKFDVYEGAE